MDKITISKLEVYAYHGVLESEKQTGQIFHVSANLYLDLKPAGVSDYLERTINYAEVCHLITKLMTDKVYDLIETCANVLSCALLQEYAQIQRVEITIFKPQAPIGLPLDCVSVQISRQRNIAYLGLGANMQTPDKMLDTAIKGLENENTRVLAVSSYYKTKPISDIPQDDYVNCAVKVETFLTAEELLKHTQNIEHEMGRVRGERFGERVIDIDILQYSALITHTEHLILPHPRMHERLFVLVPLCEIEPYLVHTLCKQRMVDLKTELEKTQTL